MSKIEWDYLINCEEDEIFPDPPRIKAEEIFPYSIIDWLKPKHNKSINHDKK